MRECLLDKRGGEFEISKYMLGSPVYSFFLRPPQGFVSIILSGNQSPEGEGSGSAKLKIYFCGHAEDQKISEQASTRPRTADHSERTLEAAALYFTDQQDDRAGS